MVLVYQGERNWNTNKFGIKIEDFPDHWVKPLSYRYKVTLVDRNNWEGFSICVRITYCKRNWLLQG